MKSIPAFNPQTESALSRFDIKFVNKYGKGSVFINALADLWTTAMFQMFKAKNALESEKGAFLISDQVNLEPLSQLIHCSDNLKEAMFQEPFGFAKAGAIEYAFEETFGNGSFRKWLDALEKRDFAVCFSLTGGN